MPFNWFKRKFGGNKDEASQQETSAKENLKAAPEETPDPPKESAKPETPADTTPTNAEDYLQWAKAAYQNIQKQKDDESPEASADEIVQDEAGQDEVDAATTHEPAPAEDVAEDAIAEPEPIPEASSEEEKAPQPAVSDVEASEDSNAAVEASTTTTAEPVVEADAAVESAEEIASEEITSEEIASDTTLDTVEESVEESSSAVGEAAVAIADSSALETDDSPEAPSIEPESNAADITETDGDPDVDAQADDAQADDAGDSEALEETVERESASDATEEAEEKADVDADAEEAVATAMPFWAKAEADRQERLEKLKETAIEEPEPEPEVELDEDFIWSAGVLASQGRKAEDVSVEEITWLTKLRQGLGKTRRGLINELKSVVGQGPLNADAVMEIESLLLQADVGIDATDYVIEALQARMKEGALPPEEAIAYLKDILRGILDKPFESDYSDEFIPEKDRLNIWLLTGVNGAGKTTTIGKLAHMTRTSDYRCLIAAADTFRAAAVEQVKVWGDRSGVDVIANPGKNTDPAAVVFDAISAAQSRDVELLLVDTAGRLQNKKNLMAELSKIRRIVDKKASNAKVESLLVLDATLGQNGLRQAQVFSEAAKLSGVVLTKLDGSAKGGVALAVVQQLGLPIRFIGAGEGIEDLRPFSSYEFVEALLSG